MVLNLNWEIIWVFVDLLILFLLMKKFLFGPVTKLLDQRAKGVTDTIEQAESQLAQAQQQKQAYTQQLAQARGEAAHILDQARKQAELNYNRRMEEAAQDVRRLNEQAARQRQADQEAMLAETRRQVAGLVLLLFAVGVFSQTGYLLIATWLFGGDASAVAPLLVLTLKVATISLASVTVFSGLDPDRLSNGLLWYGCPERLSFSISYSYRMLPMLMEEFQNVLLSYRLRGNPPAHDTLMGKVRYLIYQVKVIMHAFYPLMLNTAKRSRTTVEALELRGYRYAASSKAVKKIKLASLKVTYNDLLFLAVSFLWMTAALLASTLLS